MANVRTKGLQYLMETMPGQGGTVPLFPSTAGLYTTMEAGQSQLDRHPLHGSTYTLCCICMPQILGNVIKLKYSQEQADNDDKLCSVPI